MSITLVLGIVCFMVQLLLVMGWNGTISALQRWNGLLQDGWNKKDLDGLGQTLPMLANTAKQQVVSWKGKPHLKQSSVRWLTTDALIEERSFSPAVISGLTGLIILSALMQSLMQTMGAEDPQWVGQTMMGISVLSLGLSGWIQHRIGVAIKRCRLALDHACPELPSADNVTRDVMEQLQKQMNLLRNGQKQSLDSLGKSQATLANLGENLQFAFQKSIQEQLSPALTELSQVAAASQQANNRYVEETTRKQSQVVQGLIVQVMDGIDQAIGQSLRDTSESFAASVQRQQVSMDRWRRSVESVAEVISSLEKTTQGVTLGAERMALAAQPVEAAARVFSDSAKELQKVFPVVSQLGDMVLKAQSGLNESHSAIQRGTAEYLEVTGSIRSMVKELSQAHQEAIQRISGGVEETLVQPFATMTGELKDLQAGQRSAFEQLQTMTQNIEATLQQLQGGHENLSTLAAQIKEAGEPSIQAAASFVQVAGHLQQIVPQLEHTSQIHEVGAETMRRVSEGLQSENNRNEQILVQVQGLLTQLDATQQQMAERVAKGVDGALADKLLEARTQFVTDVTTASNALKESGMLVAQQFEQSSTNLTSQLVTSSQEVATTLRNAGTDLDVQLRSSGQQVSAALDKSSADINVSLGQVRQQLADTMTDSTKLLQQSLHQAGQTFIQDWGTMGQSIRDALEHASQSLDQSVQEVGRKLNQRIEEAGQSLEQSVQASAQSLQAGATDAHNKLSQVGDGWSSAIQDASESLRGNAQFVSDTVSTTLQTVQQEMTDHLNKSLSLLEDQMTSRLNDVVSRQQKLIEQSNTQQTRASKQLVDTTSAMTNQLRSSIQETQSALQGRLTDFSTDLQISLQEIFQQYQSGLLSAARQQEMAGQSLLDQAQEAGQQLQKAMSEAQVQTQRSLEKIGADMTLQLGQIHRQYSESLDRSQASMASLVNLQEGHIGSWQQLVQVLTPALQQLGESAQQLDSVVSNLQESMKPATTVSENFKQASNQLQAVFPNITETANSYHQFNESLQQASNALSFTADKYIKAGGDMDGLLAQVQQSLGLQNQSNDAVSTTLQGVQSTIDNLEPVVRLMQQASHDIRIVSEGSTNTIETMKQATDSQNQSVQQMGKLSAQLLKTLSAQSSRLIELTSQMEQMQKVLTVGVDAFAQQLPQSVDGTLVQFDTVLAEGVLRINGSIERLREAMDDLIEQLER